MELVDCDGIAGFPTNCPLTRKIIYPGVVPEDYFVIQIWFKPDYVNYFCINNSIHLPINYLPTIIFML